jgi:sugar/nucleoside kinase (ribokinase family)
MMKKSSNLYHPLTPSYNKRGNLLIVGSVAFDSIETPFGKIKKTLGGSAGYFSLAASFFARPSVVAVVGKDFTAVHGLVLKKKNIDISGLEQKAGKTFSWGGKYSFDLNNRETLFTHLNVFESFKPKLSADHKTAKYVFLGNIHPTLQLDVLSQVKKPKLVGLDTMNLWIKKTPKELAKILRLVDVFVINDSEARQLSGEHNLVKGAKGIMGMMSPTTPPSDALGHPSSGRRGSPTLIIKQGEYGLLMFRGGGIFHLPGYPLEDVTDPTGAGDSFAGGFMGYLCREGSRPFPTWGSLKRACVAGSVMASFCCEQLGTKRLQNLSPRDIAKRFAEFKKLTNF